MSAPPDRSPRASVYTSTAAEAGTAELRESPMARPLAARSLAPVVATVLPMLEVRVVVVRSWNMAVSPCRGQRWSATDRDAHCLPDASRPHQVASGPRERAADVSPGSRGGPASGRGAG